MAYYHDYRTFGNRVIATEDNGQSATYNDLADFSAQIGKVLPKRTLVFSFCENNIGSMFGYLSFLENRIVPLLLDNHIHQDLAEQLMEAYRPAYVYAPVSRAEETAAPAEAGSTLFTGDMLSQLHTVFARMASPLILRLFLDETPLSAELRQYMEELAAQSSKLSVELGDPAETNHLPCVRVCRADGSWTGLAFHGVPGGHEFTSFVLGLYNAAGPGQALDEESRAAIQSIQKPVDFQVLVSLSCTMCPELVTAAQRLAAENPNITAQVYDLNHFPDLRERYQVMSVPCLVVNGGEQVSFGKKNVRQLLELLSQ